MSIYKKNLESLKELFSIKKDQAENEEIKKRIDESSSISGTNLWILIMAILVASIGLNMNSTAVIIGAMLISPLMGGIISIGYGFAMNDINHIKRSAINFGIQIFISIFVSVIYFKITPLTEITPELLARTEPTIWDVLIAIFAGIAGLIGLTRRERMSNIVPGTAIATALMPPLSTLGYGIAVHNIHFILGAAYLFFINSFFICLVSSVGFRLMHVIKPGEDKTRSPKSKVIFWILIIVSIRPSIYLAWNIVDETITQKNYAEFIEKEFDFSETQIFDESIDIKNKKIDIVLIGKELTSNEIKNIEKNKKIFELGNYKLKINQMPVSKGVTKDEIEGMLSGDSSILEKNKELIINNVETKESKYYEIKKELFILYPEIDEVGITKIMNKDGKEKQVLILASKEGISIDTQKRIKNWIKEKTGEDMSIIVSKNQAILDENKVEEKVE
ncbi:DUF389 domain-containing protein [Peptacetobacter sp.]|uniref:DUF389 domain-containing protein n=1 Tax=Peptacetobacter sp. TaxID=2991975 RepID=UPI00261225AA|nr:DUF389 domain-containing protein [Peptacetobacter sp.]